MRFAEWPFLSSFDEDLSNAQQVARREDQQAQARRERTPGSSVAAGATPRWHGLPRMDIIDSKDKQLAIVEMPGLTKDKVSIELRDDGALHIAGAVEHENESKDPDAKYRFSERSYGSFARTIPVPRGVTKVRLACCECQLIAQSFC